METGYVGSRYLKVCKCASARQCLRHLTLQCLGNVRRIYVTQASNTAHLETCVLFTSYLMDNTLSFFVQDIPIERPTVRNQFNFFLSSYRSSERVFVRSSFTNKRRFRPEAVLCCFRFIRALYISFLRRSLVSVIIVVRGRPPSVLGRPILCARSIS